MQIGIYLDLRNPPHARRPWPDHYAYWLDVIASAEAMGAGSVWLSEHHLYDDGYLPQPLTYAAAIAARTSRIRIGTAVVLAALRHPMQLAEEAAVVDILSAGRLDLGIGTGYRSEEFEAFGVAMDRRFELVGDTVEQVRSCWAGKATPRPVQDPMPLWGGFFGPRGARMAGHLGMGLLPSLRRAPAIVEPYTRGLAEAGLSPATARFRSVVNIVVVDDPEAAWPRVAPALVYQYESYARHGAPYFADRLRDGQHTPEALDFYAVTPNEAVRRVKDATTGLPVEEIYCWASPGGLPQDLAERHIELLCTEVAPRLADWQPRLGELTPAGC